MIVDVGVYERGERVGGECSVAQAAARAGAAADGFAWIGLVEPSDDELAELADVWSLHPLAVEDAIHAHQRPKLDRYGDTIFVVLKTARYIDHN